MVNIMILLLTPFTHQHNCKCTQAKYIMEILGTKLEMDPVSLILGFPARQTKLANLRLFFFSYTAKLQ